MYWFASRKMFDIAFFRPARDGANVVLLSAFKASR